MSRTPEYVDDPPEILDRVRVICRALPEAYEEQAWVGRRWRIRGRTFAHLRTPDTEAGPITWLKFRSRGPELDALLARGHPFFVGGYGSDVVGILIEPATDWREVEELLAESYRLFAPKRLIAQMDTAATPQRKGARGGRA